jgi:hypothetical protein
MMSVFKILLVISLIVNLLLIYSSVVTCFLIKEDKKLENQNYYREEEDFF